MSDADSEILNVVDAWDCVVGQRSRAEIHRLGLRHRAVHVLVCNRAGDLFLQHRAKTKDSNPGLWDSSAAGHVDALEDYDECAVREVREELGIDSGRSFQRLFKLPARPGTGMEFCAVYRLDHEGPFRLNPNEIQGGKWYSPIHLDRWLARGGFGLTRTFQVIWFHGRENFGGQKKTGTALAVPE